MGRREREEETMGRRRDYGVRLVFFTGRVRGVEKIDFFEGF